MPRHKRPPSPLIGIARNYLSQHVPELKDAPLFLRQLDGPPGSPRFMVTTEVCDHMHECPFGVKETIALAGDCPVLDCTLRHSVRLLLDREGEVVKVMQSGIHWK